jgi:hypothetical protein
LVSNAGFDGSGVHANFERRFDSPLAERPPIVQRQEAGIDKRVINQHRTLFRHWRAETGMAARLYSAIASILPDALEKRLYTALMRRQLGLRAAQ